MKFSKYGKSDLPACARLDCDVAEFRADHYIPKLPQEESDTRQFGHIRDKWILWDRDIGATEFCNFWPEMRDFIEGFPGKPGKVHISQMPPQTKLRLHRDGLRNNEAKAKNFPLFDSTLRFHIALRTNPQALLYSQGEFYHMGRNELWVIDNFQIHAAVNNHPTEARYHLIFDMEPTQDTMALLVGAETGLGYQNDALFDECWPKGDPLEKLRATNGRTRA